ncbi:MAG: hypothetical protein GY854_00930 [Deltaproteobacteria bacterium]|nr:hypothetical protein [Deltaproteobacteria bacterium]
MLFLLGFPSSLFAAEPALVIMIAPRKEVTISQRTWSAVHGQLSDLPVHLEIEWVDALQSDLRSQVNKAREAAARRQAVTVFWADLSVPDQVFLYISHPSGERILVRHVGSESGGFEGRLETLAVIVRTSVKAVLEGGEIGIQKSAETDAKDESLGHLEVAVSYGIAPYAEGIEWIHGPCIMLSATPRDFLRFFVAYRILLPVHFEEQGLNLELKSHPFEFGAALRWRFAKWVLDVGALLFADLVTGEIRATDGQVVPRQPADVWLMGMAPMLRIGWSPSTFATIFLSLSVDMAFNQPRYVIDTPVRYQTLVAPWSVHPFFQLGAAFTIL